VADLSNIELLRRGFGIYEREGAEGLVPLADPEIEIYTQPGLPIRQAATGRGSGVRVGNDITYLVEIRGGKVTRFHVYQQTERALEVAKQLSAEP
jgi:hypothetical protein